MSRLGNIFNSTETRLNQIMLDGDFLEINSLNMQAGRLKNRYSRTTIIAEQTVVDTTERIIGEGVNTLGFSLSFPTTTVTLQIASTSANDINTTGTGARTLFIQGLDSNFDAQTETINLNGQTGVNSANTYIRINIMVINSTGSSNSNEGIIYCSDSTDTFTAGVPQNRAYDIMRIGYSLSQTGLFTVPRGKILLYRYLLVSSDVSGSNNRVIARIKKTSKGFSGDDTNFVTETYFIDRTFQADISWFRQIDQTDDLIITAEMTSQNASVAIKLDVIIANAFT